MSRRSGPWLFSPGVDVLIGCGAWSLPLLGFTLLLGGAHAAGLGFAFYCLGLFCNNPHYMATIYRAYRTPTDFAKYRFFTVYVTVLLAATVVLLHFTPALVPWVVTLYLTWSPWHYTGQNFGIAQLFIRRSGAGPDPVARHYLWASYVLSYLGWFVALHSQRDELDPNFVSLGIPASWSGPLQVLFALTFLVCAGTAFRRLAGAVAVRALAPALILTTTQLLWFVLPSLLTRFSSLALPASYFSAGALAFMHCAQYLWITTFYARKESGPAAPFSFARYYVILVLGGIALFVPGPWIASRLFGHDFVESFLIFMALVNLHHFILDGAIWKLRDGRIGRLLLGTPQPEGALAEDHPTEHLRWILGRSAAARWLRGGFALGLLAIGAVDQWQDYHTLRGADAGALAQAEAINPFDPRAGFRRAQLLEAKGDLTGAERELRAIIARNPWNGPAERELGETLIRQGDAKAALRQYDEMALRFPEDLVSATNRGVLLRALGDPAGAAARFREALALAPGHSELHFLLADALETKGDSRSAALEYEAFLRAMEQVASEPAGGLARFIAAAIHFGKICIAEGKYRAASPWLQKAADVAMNRRDFADAAAALRLLAQAQAGDGQSEAAAETKALAAQAAGLAAQAR